MQDILISLMLKTGSVKLDRECKFCGIEYHSRGAYICDDGGRWYLHHDGLVKDGVNADSEKPAFWPTEKGSGFFR